MTPVEHIRAAVAADRASCPGHYEQTADDIAAAVCEALADEVVPGSQSTDRLPGPLLTGDRVWCDSTAAMIRREILAIAADLRGGVQ